MVRNGEPFCPGNARSNQRLQVRPGWGAPAHSPADWPRVTRTDFPMKNAYRLEKIGARVIAKRVADQLGENWKSNVGTADTAEGPTHIPQVFHKSQLIGLSYTPPHGWTASIGLRASSAGGTELLIRSHSDHHDKPQLAILECLSRARRCLLGIKPQLEQLDRIEREVQRNYRPDVPIADVPTFDEWWATIQPPPGLTDAQWMLMKDLALTAWHSRP